VASTKTTNGHTWRFWRAGGVDQVRLDTGADLVRLGELDQTLWVALSCPVKGLECDEKTLASMDYDHDGRVRAPEIVAVANWLRRVLKDPETLVASREAVALSNLNANDPDGARLLASARLVLEGLGKPEARSISVEDTLQTAAVFATARRNGDGIVPPSAIEEEAARRVAEEILETIGGAPDRSGAPGIDAARVEKFFTECEAFAAWWKRAETERAQIFPLGPATPAAASAYDAVRAKVDDYFARCRLAAFDPRAQAAVNRNEEAYFELAARDLSITSAEIAGFPLALVEPGHPMPLAGAVNPAWEAPLATFRAAVGSLLAPDATSLAEADWTRIAAALAPYRAWSAAKAGLAVEALGIERVGAILGGGTRAALEAAIAEDLAVAPHVEAIVEVEKLARCHRDFFTLANNFVSFTDFYARRKATFQAGTLFLDGRSCDLCVEVTDPAKHGTLAAMAGTYLAYMNCTRPSGEKKQIAAAITSGNSDNLFVGRNGLFYDRQGRDWDATVTRLVDHPIAVRQAFLAPYKKVVRWAEEQVAKRASAADADATAKLQGAATTVTEAGKASAPPPPAKSKFDIGVIAALGVAVGGITAALGALLQAFFGLGFWLPLGVVGAMLLISGPSMLVAYLKLRRRNLGPILDANGWAVNSLTKVNVPLGRSLTQLGSLPPGAVRSLVDPYAVKRPFWPKALLLLTILGLLGFLTWKTGHLSRWVPRVPRPEHVWPLFDSDAPGAQPEVPATPATPPATEKGP
jgi:hypothetical protein